jgi:aryl-alcohol dehydrogenase-like predicted oxidoreductase
VPEQLLGEALRERTRREDTVIAAKGWGYAWMAAA